MNAMEYFDFDGMEVSSPDYIHYLVEAERQVYADRAEHLGDPDFHNVPVGALIEKAYMEGRMSLFDPNKKLKSDSVKAGDVYESEETTHFSIVDSEGGAISLTTTINTAYGSKLVVGGAGFFLNNEMDDFSVKPGVPNFFGLIGNAANAIEANKRMLSSMTPTIVEKDNELYMVVGTPGGSTIITSVAQTILNVIEFDMRADSATWCCRFHNQWLPDLIYVEEDCFDETLTENLEAKGHEIKVRSKIGAVETIVVEDNTVHVAADVRGDDSVSGY
jgi:gamma-glutamyltranspeptidase/glutathione hydrolase